MNCDGTTTTVKQAQLPEQDIIGMGPRQGILGGGEPTAGVHDHQYKERYSKAIQHDWKSLLTMERILLFALLL